MKKFYSLITGAKVVVLVVLANFLLTFFTLPKFDLTSNKAYSISKVTSEMIRNLDDVVNIKVYLSKEVPTELAPVVSSVKSTLEELSKINSSKLTVKYFDPTNNKEVQAETERLGIAPLQFSSVKNDKFEIQTTYFGMAIEYGGKTEPIVITADVGNLEYMIASTIGRLTLQELPEVLLMSNSSSKYQLLNKYLSLNYKVTPIETTDDKQVLNKKAKCLIVIGGANKFPDKTIVQLENWINDGNGLVVFVDKFGVNGDMKATKFEETGLEKILKENGIEVESKLVIDENGTLAEFRTNTGVFRTQYPFWPQVRQENINYKIPALTMINSIVLAWASPLQIDGKAEYLFNSTPESVVTDNISDLTPKNTKIEGDKNKFILGAIVKEKKLVVIGDADFVSDQFVGNNQKNLLLALNLIDYASNDNRLTEIRGKNLEIRPLKILTENQKNVVRYSVIGFPIILLLIVYLAIYVVKKRKNI